MMGRSVTFADIQRMGDCTGDVVFGLMHRVEKGRSSGQIGGNGGRKGASGAMGVFGCVSGMDRLDRFDFVFLPVNCSDAKCW